MESRFFGAQRHVCSPVLFHDRLRSEAFSVESDDNFWDYASKLAGGGINEPEKGPSVGMTRPAGYAVRVSADRIFLRMPAFALGHAKEEYSPVALFRAGSVMGYPPAPEARRIHGARRLLDESAAVPGTNEAVCPSLPMPRTMRSILGVLP